LGRDSLESPKWARETVIHGVGVYRRGKYVASVYAGADRGRGAKRVSTREYRTWFDMLSRAYNKKYSERHPTYADVTVDSRFHDFQEFCLWGEKQVGFSKDKFELDKDILVKGNKVYSPEVCVFVPQEVNKLFTKRDAKRGEYPIGVYFDAQAGKFKAQIQIDSVVTTLGRYDEFYDAFLAYKSAKEANIRRLGLKWKDDIDARVFAAMQTYEVDIDD